MWIMLSSTRPTVIVDSVKSWVTSFPSGMVTMIFGISRGVVLELRRQLLSVRFCFFNQFAKLIEEVTGIMWAGRGFRVILHAEHGHFTMAHSFNGLVVEIDVRNFDLRGQRIGINGETVVLRGDGDFS